MERVSGGLAEVRVSVAGRRWSFLLEALVEYGGDVEGRRDLPSDYVLTANSSGGGPYDVEDDRHERPADGHQSFSLSSTDDCTWIPAASSLQAGRWDMS